MRDRPVVERHEARERAQQRRLARAVGTEDGDGLPVGRVERDAQVERPELDADVSAQRHADSLLTKASEPVVAQ